MGDRRNAIEAAQRGVDDGSFEARLAELVAVRSSSQDRALAPELRRYLDEAVGPWLRSMGFATEVHPNPSPGHGPVLVAERWEGAGLPTVVTYGHGDTVSGMESDWTRAPGPWRLRREGDRLYGRGSADNKGQHAINLLALEAVLAARAGRLGFNVKLVLETDEERGSNGLRAFVEAHTARLAGDLFLASDGPRVAPDTPTIAAGSRGNYRFDLNVTPRAGGVHSGHWGGLTTDPAVVLANALSCLCDQLVLLVEQMGELFTTPGVTQPERAAFARVLAGLARSGVVWVIVTMRSDPWHRAAEIPDLLALTEEGARLDLLPPDGAELIEMIRRPARAVGLAFEEERESRLGLDARRRGRCGRAGRPAAPVGPPRGPLPARRARGALRSLGRRGRGRRRLVARHLGHREDRLASRIGQVGELQAVLVGW